MTSPDCTLDIRSDRCPITFVKTKLLIEKMEKGQMAEVRFAGAEVLSHLPHSIRAQGHTVHSVSIDKENEEESDSYVLIFTKN